MNVKLGCLPLTLGELGVCTTKSEGVQACTCMQTRTLDLYSLTWVFFFFKDNLLACCYHIQMCCYEMATLKK